MMTEQCYWNYKYVVLPLQQIYGSASRMNACFRCHDGCTHHDRCRLISLLFLQLVYASAYALSHDELSDKNFPFWWFLPFASRFTRHLLSTTYLQIFCFKHSVNKKTSTQSKLLCWPILFYEIGTFLLKISLVVEFWYWCEFWLQFL